MKNNQVREINPYPISRLPKSWHNSVKFLGCGKAKDARIEWAIGYEGEGWYCYCGEYPEEGSVFLSKKTPKKLSTSKQRIRT